MQKDSNLFILEIGKKNIKIDGSLYRALRYTSIYFWTNSLTIKKKEPKFKGVPFLIHIGIIRKCCSIQIITLRVPKEWYILLHVTKTGHGNRSDNNDNDNKYSLNIYYIRKEVSEALERVKEVQDFGLFSILFLFLKKL